MLEQFAPHIAGAPGMAQHAADLLRERAIDAYRDADKQRKRHQEHVAEDIRLYGDRLLTAALIELVDGTPAERRHLRALWGDFPGSRTAFNDTAIELGLPALGTPPD